VIIILFFPKNLRSEISKKRVLFCTCGEEDDGLEARVLCGVDVEGLELLDLLLEDADVIHEGDDPVGGHRARMESRRSQEGGHMERHGTLGRIQDEELAPDQPQQGHLIRHLYQHLTSFHYRPIYTRI